jgi:hypothetical protein
MDVSSCLSLETRTYIVSRFGTRTCIVSRYSSRTNLINHRGNQIWMETLEKDTFKHKLFEKPCIANTTDTRAQCTVATDLRQPRSSKREVSSRAWSIETKLFPIYAQHGRHP